ncbi:MAG TPA: hypothetical protein VGK93_05775 [Candidatus Eisenbacteria bacterium]|jgi:tetratricopeptide (TPR) repeat protein
MARRLWLLFLAAALLAAPALAQHQHMSHGAPSSGLPRLENLGGVHHAVTTQSPEAQRFFDQGLFLLYGFNHAEAIRAFEEAARLDPDCAMAWWGASSAYGPNINWPMDSTQETQALAALEKARAASSKASPAERDYIEALTRRYGRPAGANRGARDSAYAAAMKALKDRYPDDLDAATLCAESMLDLSPWNQWTLDGQPLPGTLEIVSLLESVLKRNPNHVGAIHYYIHTCEAGPDHGARTIPYVERLSRMKLDAGHLVHMPSHIFQRVGRYGESESDNVEASTEDSLYVARWKPEGLYPMMYYPHNVHFVWAAASMAGRSRQALHYARRLSGLVPWDMVRQIPPMEFWSPTPYYAMIRFGRWDEILKESAPPADVRFSTGMWHFARGMAFAARRQFEQAGTERDSVSVIAAGIPLEALVSFNSAKGLLTIASNQLGGETAARQGKIEEAVRLLQQAIAVEDTLHYDEPPAWFFPVRQSLGAVLLEAGRPAVAEAAYREDLKRNPENGWSLYGLAQCARARKATKEAADAEKRFRKAWARADVKLTSSRFWSTRPLAPVSGPPVLPGRRPRRPGPGTAIRDW